MFQRKTRQMPVHRPIRMLLPGALLLAGAGCKTVGADFAPMALPEEGKVLVYLYYECDPDSSEYYTGGTVGPKFRLNGKFIGYLSPDSYIPLVLPQGSVEMELLPTWNYTFIPELKFDYPTTGPGPKYLRFDFSGKGVSYSRIKWTSYAREVNPLIARKEIASCQLNEAAQQRAKAGGLGP